MKCFDKCFFSHKQMGSGSPAFCGFQRFFQCSDGLNQGSGSGHKSRDPDSNAKCFFTNKKLSRGSPAFCRLFKFVQCFSQNLNIEESGSRRNFSKCFSAIKKLSRGPPAFNRFFKFWERFDHFKFSAK